MCIYDKYVINNVQWQSAQVLYHSEGGYLAVLYIMCISSQLHNKYTVAWDNRSAFSSKTLIRMLNNQRNVFLCEM